MARPRPAAAVASAGALVAAALLGRTVRRVARSWPERLAVRGPSMEPLLRDGDWLLVDPLAFRAHAPRVGELVVVPDPRDASRLLVKRVGSVTGDGRLLLAGDALLRSTDSRHFGAVAPSAVVGRPWWRYAPIRRMGRVR